MGGDSLSLSPGEEARYYQETFRRLRCERLHQVRQKEEVLARERRRQFQRQSREEEKAFKTVEVRAQLAAKRAQLEGLLELRRVCEAKAGAAMREAELLEAEADAQRAAASAAEALRREEEALRSLRAARAQRAAHSAKQQRAAEETRRASEVAAAERRRAQRAASLGRMAQAAKELVRCEAELHEAGPALPVEVIEAVTEIPRRAPCPTPAQRKAARARSAAAWQREEAAKSEESSSRARAEDAKKERLRKVHAVAEAAAEAAEAAQPRSAAVAEEEVSLCEDCKELRAEMERIMAYRTLSPRELRGPMKPELQSLPGDAESVSQSAREDTLQSCEPIGTGPTILEETLPAARELQSFIVCPDESEQTLWEACREGHEGSEEALRESCESEGLELPAVSAQVLLPGVEVSEELDSQSCAGPETSGDDEQPDEKDPPAFVDGMDESGTAFKEGVFPAASRAWTAPLLKVPSSSDAESSGHETPGPMSSPQMDVKEELLICSAGPGCSVLSTSFDSVSTASEPRPLAGRRFGEEDLSQRLGEICRQLDAVF